MDEATVRTLVALDRRFYDGHADTFSQTRARPWTGWHRLIEVLRARWGDEHPSHVRAFDVGCGNGRFARFLAETLPRTSVDYLGFDHAAGLLARARERLLLDEHRPHTWRLTAADAVFGATEALAPGRRFDLIGLFGVLHHVPGFHHRQRLLASLAARLHDRGVLAVTVWQLDDPRLVRKRIPWAEVAPRLDLDRDQLDEDDLLLPWQGHRDQPRYVHRTRDHEIDCLLDAPGLRLYDSFHADGATGRSNRYLLIVRSDA